MTPAEVAACDAAFDHWRIFDAERVERESAGQLESWTDWIRWSNQPDRESERRSYEARAERATIFTGGARFGAQLPDDPDPEHLRIWARRREAVASGIAARHYGDPEAAWDALAEYAMPYGITPPRRNRKRPNGRDTLAGGIHKMCSAKWWKRKGRAAAVREIEADAIRAGKVCSKAAPYASDDACTWNRASRDNINQLALAFELVNEQGETYGLDAAIEGSVSNPKLRRHEVMIRVKGLEAIADARGYVGLFLTWTLPSRFHSRHEKTGSKNQKWDGSMPDAGQAELCEQWAHGRALLKKAGIEYFGMRVAEPHHDATPHWHLLVFCEPANVGPLVSILEAKARAESPDEPGAADRRFKVECISKERGGAIAYVAKYVSKNVDGHGLAQLTTLGDDGKQVALDVEPIQGAERILAWSRAWRIRQFQFFGFGHAAPVSVYRELRRCRDPFASNLESHRAAADVGDWCAFVQLMLASPAMFIRRDDGPLSALTANGERATPPPIGLVGARGEQEITRIHAWQLLRKVAVPDGPEISAPWTRVNNCYGALQADSPPTIPDPVPDRPPDPGGDRLTDPAADSPREPNR